MKKIQIFIPIILLIIGIEIYTDLRGYQGLIFDVYNDFTFINLKQYKSFSSPFVMYNLPDGLWLAALLFCIIFIWGDDVSNSSNYWLTTAYIMAVIIELLQLVDIINGTFDPYDIIIYSIVYFIIIIYHNIKLKRWNIS